MSDERDHVDLLNLTKAMKWRSPGGRDVCWCIQFELLTLLAYAQAHTDVGLGCSERATQQMTPRWERCCGDRKHGWPESCLRGRSQCDACGKQEEDELLACVVILYRVTQKVPYHAKMTFISVFFTSNMSLPCQWRLSPLWCHKEDSYLSQVSHNTTCEVFVLPSEILMQPCYFCSFSSMWKLEQNIIFSRKIEQFFFS